MSRARPTDLACKEVVGLVSDFIEGALHAEERTRFEHHLVTCQECMAYVRQMRQTVSLAGKAALDERAIPEPTRDRLLQTFRAFNNKGT